MYTLFSLVFLHRFPQGRNLFFHGAFVHFPRSQLLLGTVFHVMFNGRPRVAQGCVSPRVGVCSSVYSVVWIATAISAEWLLDDWTVTIRVEPFFVGSENFPRVSVSEALLSPRSRSSGMPALRVPGHTIHSRWSTPTSSSWRPAKIRGKPFFPPSALFDPFLEASTPTRTH